MTTPIQGFAAASLTVFPNPTAITALTPYDDKGLFTNTNLTSGSDVLAIRRASTTIFTGAPTTNDVYLQANGSARTILFGSASGNVPTTNAAGTTNLVGTAMAKYPFSTTNNSFADTWKYNVHVYFVAPCSFGTGANDLCQTGDDAIPTLKRLELTSVSGATTMKIEPLVEGIEYMKVRYGIDNSPTTINATTGFAGDGIPDVYDPAVTAAQWPLVVSIRIYLLVRSPEATTGYTDTKTYDFSNTTVSLGPFNDAFKRHVYSSEVRPMNLAGRREIPE